MSKPPSAKLPWGIGIAAAVVSFPILLAIEGPSRCRDGWESSSIGRSGACSHHGGVADRFSPLLALAIGAGSGFGARNLQLKLIDTRRRRDTAEREAAAQSPIQEQRRTVAEPALDQAAQDAGYVMRCASCAAGMRAVTISAGAPPHGKFWECLHCRRLAERA